MGWLRRTFGSSGSFVFSCVDSGAPRCCRVHSGSRGFTGARLAVVGFFRIRMGPLQRDKWWSVSFGFTLPRLVVVGYIRVRVGSHGRANWSSGSFGFAWVHWGGLGVVGFIRVGVGSLVRA